MTDQILKEKVEDVGRILQNAIGDEGPVYFNPPNKLEYPCIVYELAKRTSEDADDIRYIKRLQFTITVITRDPYSDIPGKVWDSFDYISHDTRFVSERLYHDVYTHIE